MQSGNAELTESIPASGNQKTSLIPCSSCNHAIAQSAISCPSCGATNSYVHPRIASFTTFSGMSDLPPFQFTSTGMTAEGATEASHLKYIKWGVGLFFVMMMLMIFTPFGKFAMLLLFGSMMLFGYGVVTSGRDTSNRFKIDYSSGTPIWSSTDDQLWAAAKAHFLD